MSAETPASGESLKSDQRAGGTTPSNGYDPETFREVLQLVIAHDAIERAWIQFLMGVGGAVVVALWSVANFGEKSEATRVLRYVIAILGSGCVLCLVVVFYRARQWTHWMISRVKVYQQKCGMVVYPVGRPPRRTGILATVFRFPEWCLDRLFHASLEDEAKPQKACEEDLKSLPTGGGPIFNLVAWIGVMFTALVIVTAALLFPSRESKALAHDYGKPLFLTNSVHEVTNAIPGVTNVMRVTAVTIIGVSK